MIVWVHGSIYEVFYVLEICHVYEIDCLFLNPNGFYDSCEVPCYLMKSTMMVLGT